MVESGGKKVLIDSGMGPEVDNFLKFAGENVRDIDMILLSHLHIDHIGGAVHLRSKYGIPVALGQRDVELIGRMGQDPQSFQKEYSLQLKENGMPENLIGSSLKETPIMREMEYYRNVKVDVPINGEFKIPGSDIKALEVPGHSPGSMCIYLPSQNAIFTGDHILKDISPNISKYIGIRDSLGSYLSSLHKLKGMQVAKVLPGHGRIFDNLQERIDELSMHHSRRMEEILAIAKEWLSPYEIARKMKWSKGRNMDSMNSMEKIFAMGEATSHLERLEEEGKVESRMPDSVRQYKSS